MDDIVDVMNLPFIWKNKHFFPKINTIHGVKFKALVIEWENHNKLHELSTIFHKSVTI